MSTQIASFWQSVLLIGRTVFPYVGLVVLIVLAILVVALTLYLLYRIARRLPVSLRHIAWRTKTIFRKLFGWLRRDRSALHTAVLACFHDSPKNTFPLHHSFPSKSKAMPWTATPASRPPEPLYLVLGPAGAGKSTLLSQYVKDLSPTGAPSSSATSTPICDLTWWRLKQGWALEVSAHFLQTYDSLKFSSMLRILEEMCPERPVDGVIVVTPAAQLVVDGANAGLGQMIGAAASRIANEIGHSLPVHLVISGADSLQGFDSFLKLRAAVGERDEPLGLQLPALTIKTLQSPQTSLSKSLRDIILGKVLFALSRQSDSTANFALRNVLNLPAEVIRMHAVLEAFHQQLCDGPPGASSLQSAHLTGFLAGTPSAEREFVLAGKKLGQQLFSRKAHQEPSRAYQAKLGKQLRRRKAILAFCLFSCAILMVWSGTTWTRMSEDVAQVQQILGEIGPELHVARNSHLTLANSVGIRSLEKLINVVATLDEKSIAYVLVPSSWTSELRNEALASIGEVISRTLIRARAEVLSTSVPQVHDATITADGGVPAQRIEDLPAYQDLISFLDYQESTWASMDSGKRLKKRITYGDFLRFLGVRTEQLKLRRIDWGASMPSAVTHRFHVENLKSPENDAAVRHIVDAYWDRLLSQAFDQNPVVVLSEELVEGVRNVSGAGAFGIQEALALDGKLKKIRREVALPSSRRIVGTKSEALAFFAKTQFRLGTSNVVSSGQMIDMTSALEKRFELIRARMVQLEGDGIGLFYTVDAREGTLQLSGDLKRFATAYAAFMSQPFMQPVGSVNFVMPGARQYVEWSLPKLEPIRGLVDAYRDYSTGPAGQAFDLRLKAGLLRLARSNFLKQADVLFLQAARIREEGQLQSETAGANNAVSGARHLSSRMISLATAGKLYRTLQPAESWSVADSAVAEILVQENVQLLRLFEAELNKADPYGPLAAEAMAWLRSATDGKMAVNTFKLNAKDRLVSAREYVRMQYGALASPLVDFLSAGGSPTVNDEVTVRWSRMREALDGYQKGNASNSVSELERYVLGLTKLRTADECTSFLDERQLPVQRGDYFSHQLVSLDAAILDACEQRRNDSNRRNYETFAAWFNSAVAGRYPFSSNGLRSGSSQLSVPVFERLMSLYSELKLQTDGANKLASALPSEAARFITQMDILGAFFLARPNATPPTAQATNTATSITTKPTSGNEGVRADVPFRARLVFRSNRAQEVGADQIIEWSVISGGRRYSSRGNDPFQWKIGEPIEIKLRWAANSPVSPLATTKAPYTHSVEERSATFRYGGDWALLEMLDIHAASPATGEGGHVLLLRIPTIGPEGRHDTKAYITVMPPEGRGPLIPEFPAIAPLIPRSWSRS